MNFKTIQFLDKKVPELIFGSLTMAPLQRNMDPVVGGKVIAAALKKGLRWIDTAQMYGSYPHIKQGINHSGIGRDQLVISTKSAKKSYEEMLAAIDEAMNELDLKYIDLFLLHAVRSFEDFQQRAGALQALLEAKEEKKIGQIGISTHSTMCAKILATDERLDWYHLIFNQKGIGITDSTLTEQEKVVEIIKKRGARIYAMKPLGGGYLKSDAEDALKWIKNHPHIDAVALGMTSEEEVEMNIKIFTNQLVPAELSEQLKSIDKSLFVFKVLCIGCGKCEETCEQSAIAVQSKLAVVNKEKCILCGYCVPTCPKFALRII
ncbi:MAG: aldo/keto reductase [Spirochaetes bacterium]|nr:aldo/keto reductase [Spirochaetota bacterium]